MNSSRGIRRVINEQSEDSIMLKRFFVAAATVAMFFISALANLADAAELIKPEYGFELRLPARWTIQGVNSFNETEFGGSYQARLVDSQGVATILLISARVQPNVAIKDWVTGTLLSKTGPESMLQHYAGSYSVSYKSLEYSPTTLGATTATMVEVKGLRINKAKPNYRAVYAVAPGNRWMVVMLIYNHTKVKPIAAKDLATITKAVTLTGAPETVASVE